MSHGIQRAAGACAVLLFLAGAARGGADVAKPTPLWPGSFTARLEALALLQTLNADLLSHDSATLTLERWCDAHRLASPAHIIAEKQHGADKAPTAEQRRLLQVSATEPVRYRRVRLSCGGHVLSEADNWYVPARLTAEMNRQLDTSDIAFGRAVLGLHFQRHTLSARLLWSPLPQGWEMAMSVPAETPAALPVPYEVLQHRAMLTLPDGTPFSEVVETYTSEVLAFPAPPRP
jgi:chorismate-pyruvate lyase